MGRPWAQALTRLLTARPGLKKGVLAEMAGIKNGTISGLVNGATPPHTLTLQKLADALTAYDRRLTPSAPAVELWEFFVSDEQAALLRTAAHKQQQLVQQDEMIDRVLARLAPLVTSVIQQEATGVPALQPPIPTPMDAEAARSEGHRLARGNLQRNRKKAS